MDHDKKDHVIGSKIVGRYGNRGVVSSIIPRDTIPGGEHVEFDESKMILIPPLRRVFDAILDLDLSSMYPSTIRTVDSIRKSKNNSRKQRRILRRASQRLKTNITCITYNYFDKTIRYFDKGGLAHEELRGRGIGTKR
jgi:hypothetical protein